jgi:hypothetical protein
MVYILIILLLILISVSVYIIFKGLNKVKKLEKKPTNLELIIWHKIKKLSIESPELSFEEIRDIVINDIKDDLERIYKDVEEHRRDKGLNLYGIEEWEI